MKARIIKGKGHIKNMIFEGYGIQLHPITPTDLPALRRWRNSPEISQQMVDSSHITPAKQRLWYERIINIEEEAHWVVWCKDVRTGAMNLKSHDSLYSQKFLDGGLYVGDSNVKHGLLGYAIALMQLDIAFIHLKCLKYETSFRENNLSARRFNQQLGYQEINKKDGFIRVSITNESYLKSKDGLLRYFKNDH